MDKEKYQQYLTEEHDACGIGAVVNIDGRKTEDVLDDALSIVEKLEHRAGKDATGKVGDGVGILLQICHSFFKKKMISALFQVLISLFFSTEISFYRA